MTQLIAQFHEEVSAKLPALTLLNNLGYKFIPASQMSEWRESLSSVVLVKVLQNFFYTSSCISKGILSEYESTTPVTPLTQAYQYGFFYA